MEKSSAPFSFRGEILKRYFNQKYYPLFQMNQ